MGPKPREAQIPLTPPGCTTQPRSPGAMKAPLPTLAAQPTGRTGCYSTHRPLEHDLGVTDGLGVGDVGASNGAAGEAATEPGHLVGP